MQKMLPVISRPSCPEKDQGYMQSGRYRDLFAKKPVPKSETAQRARKLRGSKALNQSSCDPLGLFTQHNFLPCLHIMYVPLLTW